MNEKFKRLGRVLSKKEQKEIIGGLDGGNNSCAQDKCISGDEFIRCNQPLGETGHCGSCHCKDVGNNSTYDVQCSYCVAD